MIMNKKGFTLVELILYVTLASVLLIGFAMLIPYVLESRLKNQVILEVEEQARVVSSYMGLEIRNAEGVNSPAAGASGGSLSLDVVAGVDDPTVFDLNSDSLRVTKGAAPSDVLTNDKVKVTSLNFVNLTRPDTAGAVRVEFTIEYNNPSNRSSFDYSKDFYMTGVIKKS
jgi:type II secretory pathway pseudopilin PulG